MKIENDGNTSLLTAENGSTEQAVSATLAFAEKGISTNLILNLLAIEDVSTKNLKSLKPLSAFYKKAKKSLVIVCKNIDFNEVPSYLNVVPTLIEANDIIDMEEIERDLGF